MLAASMYAERLVCMRVLVFANSLGQASALQGLFTVRFLPCTHLFRDKLLGNTVRVFF